MGEVPAPKLIIEFCEALKHECVNYCHWKSNNALDRSASGENDLDILVDRSDVSKLREILFRLDFKECQTPKFKQLPGIQDFFGYDLQADKFIHVHAHYQLILGHDLSKNYRIPIERPYLESAQESGLFKAPAPEFELVIFVIRMMIKHSTWDTILTREGALSKSEKKELVYLEERADRAKVGEILVKYLPFIDDSLFDDCLRALHPGAPVMRRIQAGHRLLSRLDAHACRPEEQNFLIKQWRRVSLLFQFKVLKRRYKMSLTSGGAIIAIVGGDGAGKTTAIEGLSAWLASHFETTRFHMGKPSWSKTTIAIRGFVKIGTLLHLYHFQEAPAQFGEDENNFDFPGFPWLLRQACTARDRYLTYKKARRFATNGGIVICDRYHISKLRFMESPNSTIRMTNQVKDHRLVKYVLNLEKNYYQQILLPELLIVLRVDPEIAIQRRGVESEYSVRPRSSEVWQADWSGIPVRLIDASQPKEAVLAEIKSLVWADL
jgi:thymidylate kinase